MSRKTWKPCAALQRGLDMLAAHILWKSIPSITDPLTFCKSRVMLVLKPNKVQELSNHRPITISSVIIHCLHKILGRWWTEVTELLEQFTFQIDRQQIRRHLCSSLQFQPIHPWPLCCYGGHIEVVWYSQLRFHFWDCGEVCGPASELYTLQLQCNDLHTCWPLQKGQTAKVNPYHICSLIWSDRHYLIGTIKVDSLVYDDNVTLFAKIPEGMQICLDRVVEGLRLANLRVNIKKIWSITIKVNKKAKFIVLVSSPCGQWAGGWSRSDQSSAFKILPMFQYWFREFSKMLYSKHFFFITISQ